MKKIRQAIKKANEFNKKCMAEVFGLMQESGTEFVRGNVCVEVHVRKGIEFYTVWRLDKSGEFYEVEVAKTSNKNDIATHLYNIVEYESCGWDVPYESASEVIMALA